MHPDWWMSINFVFDSLLTVVYWVLKFRVSMLLKVGLLCLVRLTKPVTEPFIAGFQ